jgi:large subunit ribosomal protein L10
MRPEKAYLVDELNKHLDKSEYIYLANYERITVEETATLRAALSAENAEFHVIKNSLFGKTASDRGMPDLKHILTGQTAIIVGGNNPSAVAKIVQKFIKDAKKVELKGGALGDRALSPADIDELAKLPSIEILRAQLMGLLNTPATRMVSILNAVPQSVVTVLKAYVDQQQGEAA